jgi:uncharacterized pyridoxal phosphate-dependent enzyme
MARAANSETLTRRNLLKSSGLLALCTAIPGAAAAGVKEAAGNPLDLSFDGKIYESIGVRPIVNCRGTFTIISGSQSLPETKKAMDEASRHYVNMDELMEAVGKRLAELTKAEWGIVTAGCSAAITLATAACIAGANPERMQRLPNLDGLKSEVIMAKYSRNDYDHAARMPGAKIIEINSYEELVNAFNSRTAMVLIFSSPAAEKGPFNLETTCKVANAKGVPVLVDAAAENLTIPNIHLQLGATMVAYSGGKCLRGPQCAGLLLGKKELVQAAWINSAPHHAFGRSLKVGKEEIMGMLAAVEAWTKRDHDAEWKTWESWLAYISDRVTKVPGVTTEYVQPQDLSNHATQLRIKWDGKALNITGTEVAKTLAEGNPRIILASGAGKRPDEMASSVSVMPYMMMPNDHKIAAEALYQILTKPPKFENPVLPTGAAVNIAGVWEVSMNYLVGAAKHRFIIEQTGNRLIGLHEGEHVHGSLKGAAHGDQVTFAARHPIEGTTLLYTFSGTATGDSMSGTVLLGEYGSAQWEARRESFAR